MPPGRLPRAASRHSAVTPGRTQIRVEERLRPASCMGSHPAGAPACIAPHYAYRRDSPDPQPSDTPARTPPYHHAPAPQPGIKGNSAIPPRPRSVSGSPAASWCRPTRGTREAIESLPAKSPCDRIHLQTEASCKLRENVTRFAVSSIVIPQKDRSDRLCLF
jgi:hypothetical protein